MSNLNYIEEITDQNEINNIISKNNIPLENEDGTYKTGIIIMITFNDTQLGGGPKVYMKECDKAQLEKQHAKKSIADMMQSVRQKTNCFTQQLHEFLEQLKICIKNNDFEEIEAIQQHAKEAIDQRFGIFTGDAPFLPVEISTSAVQNTDDIQRLMQLQTFLARSGTSRGRTGNRTGNSNELEDMLHRAQQTIGDLVVGRDFTRSVVECKTSSKGSLFYNIQFLQADVTPAEQQAYQTAMLQPGIPQSRVNSPIQLFHISLEFGPSTTTVQPSSQKAIGIAHAKADAWPGRPDSRGTTSCGFRWLHRVSTGLVAQCPEPYVLVYPVLRISFARSFWMFTFCKCLY